MTPSRDLDFAPLTNQIPLRTRWKVVTADNLMVVAGTVGVLLVLVPVAVFVGLLVTGTATDPGGLVVLAMCVGGGIYVMLDLLRRAGVGGALEGFARANDLELVRGSMVPHYGGSLFAGESEGVRQSVRTRGEPFVEVGERFAPTTRRDPGRAPEPGLFFRARLAGRPGRDPAAAVPPALHDALSRFAGTYTLEARGDELTLFGTHGVGVETPGRLEEAFALVDELVARVDADLVGSSGEDPSPVRQPGHPRRAGVVVGWTLGLVAGGAVVLAFLMAVLDGPLVGNEGPARVVVALLVGVALAAVAWVVRTVVTPRSAERGWTRE